MHQFSLLFAIKKCSNANYYLNTNGEEAQESHRAYKEWAGTKCTHGTKINGRATVNLKIYYLVTLIIVRLKKGENESVKQR